MGKFAGVGVECLATVLVLNMLVYFSFDCLMQLPTGAFFVPASDDTEAAYAYADDDPGTSYAVDAAYPYTSFIFTSCRGCARSSSRTSTGGRRRGTRRWWRSCT